LGISGKFLIIILIIAALSLSIPVFAATINESYFEFSNELSVYYVFENGDVNNMKIDSDAKSLIIEIDSYGNGVLNLGIPRDLLDAKFGNNDDVFFLLVDEEGLNFIEEPGFFDSNLRFLTIPIPDGASKVEIIGTEFFDPKIPEWVRNIFIWYAEGQIGEDDLISALQFLIKEGIIKV